MIIIFLRVQNGKLPFTRLNKGFFLYKMIIMSGLFLGSNSELLVRSFRIFFLAGHERKSRFQTMDYVLKSDSDIYI